MTVPEAYELVEKRKVEELRSQGYLLSHKKTGARIFVLENDDENKVFYVSFRTPPLDSTGCAHIMEHSVLCGSQRFPAKDPFVELAKGSLNTFLNAMTYPDKTVYPVASCNEKDFENLMHVYMDAVYRPNIYKRPQIFKQEGWHYELTEPEGELTINGVVYNEMKGAFSSPEDTIDRKMYELLYPDTAYGLESGGDPDRIPELTYEAFQEFHGRYYHPSNSFVYLYGNCDMAERLEWLDREYLSGYDRLDIDSTIKLQEPFEKEREKEISYSITENEETTENTYFQYGWVIDTALNRELYLAFQILDYVLFSAPGAPIKEKLLRSGICSDVISSYENGILQPCFCVMIKNSEPEHKETFIKLLTEGLSDIARDGIDRKSLKAGINYFEFKYREADFGAYPKGLMFGLQCLDSWIYDEKDPFMHISATSTIGFLKEKIDTGYFEELIRKYFLENSHRALIVAKPERGLTAKKEKELAKHLAAYKETLGDAEREALIKDTAALKAYQSEPSTEEELLSIPMLAISDIKKEAAKVDNELIEKDGIKYLYHDVDTNGIVYLTMVFNVKDIPVSLVPYINLFQALVGAISTEHYSYFELANEINANTGGIMAATGMYSPEDDFVPTAEIEAKMLEDKVGFAMDMIEEMIFGSKLDEYVRIKELLAMFKSRMQMAMLSSGHMFAARRALSYLTEMGVYESINCGYDYYKFIDGLLADFDSKKEELTGRLKEAVKMIFRRDNLLVSVGGSRNALKDVMGRMDAFAAKLSGEKPAEDLSLPAPEKKNEGFKSSSQVQYVAVAGNFKQAGLSYTGALRILGTVMAYDYLWVNVRVLGGAYGCMSQFARNGSAYMVSYRDPNLSDTLEVYRKAVDYLEGFEVSDRDMTKYIIGTIAVLDTPLNPRMKCDRGMRLYMNGSTIEEIQKERDAVLSADCAAVRALAAHVKAVLDQGCLCVLGAEEKINEESTLFREVKTLF